MTKATLYGFCGKMASGKSTLAKKIAEQNSLTLISEDVLLSALYPDQIVDVASYGELSGKLKCAMTPVLVDLLRTGSSIVLDFPANTVNQRKWVKGLIAQADSYYEFHYLNRSDVMCIKRLKARAVKEPDRHATDTDAMFDAITQYFEPPAADEGLVIVEHG